MRTTLTLDDDLGEALRSRARETGASFKDVVNDAIRRGLATGASPEDAREPFVVEARSCGFRAGVDVSRLNQLLDEMEIEDFSSDAGEVLKIADS